ncbi:MAG: hypothetical protein HY048_16925 [Acidobacteria bacterium]|nr:hypothetical protein [Acidobacteriota bacterium]
MIERRDQFSRAAMTLRLSGGAKRRPLQPVFGRLRHCCSSPARRSKTTPNRQGSIHGMAGIAPGTAGSLMR